MRQNSTKIWCLKTDVSQHWFSVADALAEGYKREDLEKFDSQSEFVRFKDLLILQDLGEIKDLQCHPKFRISQRFNRYYSPDFVYYSKHDNLEWIMRCINLGIKVENIDEVHYWVLVAEDVKGVTRKGGKLAYLLRENQEHIFERFQEQNPQYLFELYPPLE